jgi:site-specific DNA-adenine methylase
MWSYYGSKSKVIKEYHEPLFDTIIEPFAGTARYSLRGRNWEKRVILVDKYKVIVDIWNYLKNASEKDILGLPNFKHKESVEQHGQLSQVEKWLIGFCIHRGCSSPGLSATEFNSWSQDKKRIAGNLFKIRHWEIINGDYFALKNIEATWYIDPPYQEGGHIYKYNTIDYKKLGDWCRQRNGHVMVCENTYANWLPFRPLKSYSGQMRTTTEAIWTKGQPEQSVMPF